MSEAITAYTTTDAVRGAIGLTPNDIPDASLIDQQLALELEADLSVWLPTHAALYAAGIASGAASADKLKAAYINLYAQWFCASSVVTQMTLGIPMMVSDGKSELQRFTSLDLDALMERVVGRRDLYRNKLAEGEGQAAVLSVSIMQAGVPAYDPVTGA
jgi:hypothetical protein